MLLLSPIPLNARQVRGDLIRILNKILKRKDKLDGIIIETTGMADPGPVSEYVLRVCVRSEYEAIQRLRVCVRARACACAIIMCALECLYVRACACVVYCAVCGCADVRVSANVGVSACV